MTTALSMPARLHKGKESESARGKEEIPRIVHMQGCYEKKKTIDSASKKEEVAPFAVKQRGLAGRIRDTTRFPR